MRILVLLFSSFLQLCYALDAIKKGERLGVSQTIVSSGGHFELGFFSPGQSKNLYVGIWYKKISVYKRTVVWVTNREYPISMSFNSSCYLSINKDGNLVISDGRGMSYSISSVSTRSSTSATLLDSGNFVLRDTISNEVLWQSFDHPADTFLPGMKFGTDKRNNRTWSLTSWNSLEDPSPGGFSTVLDTSSSEFLIMKGSQKFWTSGRWNGVIFSQVPNLRLNDIYNVSFVSNENVTYLTYDLHNTSMISRSVMDTTGKLKKYLWLDGTKEWALFWDLPRPCQVYALCGAFSTCADMQIPNCRCLQGFEPYSLRDWMQQDWSAGCVRKSSLQCGGKDLFVLVNNVKFPVNFESLSALDSEQCKQACSRNCSCNAYAYKGNCHLWMGDLLGIEQLERGDYIFLRVAASELQLINSGKADNHLSSKLN
ncbi:hypothetical protein Scep_016658 [Stephania cephalantha]|uniref:non-specific serine/threonine protein kinase n=1 Tax=Stephania cephalantha TaxID=152367 RepID=A0AAP0INK7_9MAGN